MADHQETSRRQTPWFRSDDPAYARLVPSLVCRWVAKMAARGN